MGRVLVRVSRAICCYPSAQHRGEHSRAVSARQPACTICIPARQYRRGGHCASIAMAGDQRERRGEAADDALHVAPGERQHGGVNAVHGRDVAREAAIAAADCSDIKRNADGAWARHARRASRTARWRPCCTARLARSCRTASRALRSHALAASASPVRLFGTTWSVCALRGWPGRACEQQAANHPCARSKANTCGVLG